MRAVYFCGVLALVLLLGLGAYLSPLEPGILALQMAFSPRGFAAVVHAWSPADLVRYRLHLPVDVVLALSYGAFGYLLVRRSGLFAAWSPASQRLVAGVLPVAASLDIAENLFHGWLTAVPRFDCAWVYAVSALCSSLKWLGLLGFVLAVMAAWAFGGDDSVA